MKISGKVIRKQFGKGSKSEHSAIYIKTDKDEFVLRKVGDNPFENNALQSLVGMNVVAEGTVKDYIFFAKDVKKTT